MLSEWPNAGMAFRYRRKRTTYWIRLLSHKHTRASTFENCNDLDLKISCMAVLHHMPPVLVPRETLLPFGRKWTANGGSPSRSRPHSSNQLGNVFNNAVAQAVATMLGRIEVVAPKSATALVPPDPDCIEVGATRVIGGVRPQNFDVCYRPDGIRFAFDGKTLNELKSVRKNYQNMINDLSTEATTVHTRFPYAVVAFMVIVPAPCLQEPQRAALIGTLERLARRTTVTNHSHLAEAISLVVWHPDTGTIDPEVPPGSSSLRMEAFSRYVETAYFARYEGLPPHTV
jgi:hypothetical protein